MMAYLGALVDSGVFGRIVLSFLPVGHTHEDIDQMFSTFSKALKYTTRTPEKNSRRSLLARTRPSI